MSVGVAPGARTVGVWALLAVAAVAAAHEPAGPALAAARQEIAAAVLDGAIVAIGGFGADRGTLGSVEAWRPGTAAWQAWPALPVPVHHPAAAVVAGRLMVVGGYRGPGLAGATDAVQVFDPAVGRWTLGPPLPTARGSASAAVLEGRLVVVGGARDGVSVGDVAAFDPVAGAWHALPPLPTPRDHLGVAVLDGRLHAVGGRDGTRDLALAAHEVFDPVRGAWTTASPMPTGRSGHAVAAVDGCLVALGGEGNPAAPDGMFADVERYHPVAAAWTRLPPMATPLHGAGAVVVDGALWLVGGAVVAGFGAVPAVAVHPLPPCA